MDGHAACSDAPLCPYAGAHCRPPYGGMRGGGPRLQPVRAPPGPPRPHGTCLTRRWPPPAGLECGEGFEGISVGGSPVPSRFDYFGSGVGSFVAYDLAGTGLVQDGAAVCIHLRDCCRCAPPACAAARSSTGEMLHTYPALEADAAPDVCCAWPGRAWAAAQHRRGRAAARRPSRAPHATAGKHICSGRRQQAARPMMASSDLRARAAHRRPAAAVWPHAGCLALHGAVVCA